MNTKDQQPITSNCDKTNSFYNANAQDYFNQTVNIDMSATALRCLAYIESGASILDCGCGSGRDSKFFKDHGFEVTAFDASPQLAHIASNHIGQTVHVASFQTFKTQKRFNLIFCNASLLHVPKNELQRVLSKLTSMLKQNGLIYVSFKEAEREWTDNLGRYFCGQTMDSLTSLLEGTDLNIECMWSAEDKIGRRENWICAIARVQI